MSPSTSMPSAAECKQAPGLFRPVIDRNRCEGKDACVAACPYDVFEVRKIDRADYQRLNFIGKIKNRAHRGRVAYTPNADQCRACGLCVKACPEHAITLAKALENGR